MPNTNAGYPYVDGTELVKNWPAALLGLAQAVGDNPLPVFTDATARNSAYGTPAAGKYPVCFLSTPKWITMWNGSAWVVLDSLDRIGGTWRRNANQSVPTATLTAISWDTEDADTDSIATVPTSTLTIPTGFDGMWSISAVLAGLGGAAPTLRIVTGGVTYDSPGSLFSGIATLSIVIPLAAAATVVVSAYQNSGGASNVTGRVHLYRVGP